MGLMAWDKPLHDRVAIGNEAQEIFIFSYFSIKFERAFFVDDDNAFDFHAVPLAIGIRRPKPNALGETLNPGAACLRLNSLRSTIPTTRSTNA